jgi:hypothetical protein
MKLSYFFRLGVFFVITPLSLLSQSVTFSPQRGFYASPFQLTLTASAGATIKYTTNGTAPTSSTGLVYSGAIDITTTTVVRAIAVNGQTVTPVATNTYIFLDSVIKQPANIPGWPNTTYDLGANGATAIQDYAMDPNVVNDPAYSAQIINAMKDIPTLSIVMDKNDFLTMYDGDLEFPTSVELIYPNNPLGNEQFDCGIESHSHLRLKRSMRLVLNDTYFPSGLKSNILKSAPLNSSAAMNFFTRSKIVLRAGNNRSWARNWNPDRTCYTRDQWYRDAQIDVSGIGSHGTFVHLYVNGLYWGLFNPSERYDAGWEAGYMGGNFEDWMEFDQDGIRSGDATRFNYLTGPLVAKDMSIAANYTELKEYLDVANFSDYLMITWMTGMQDWPGNNYSGGNRNNPVGPNQFFAWDCEWSWDVSNNSNNGAWVHPAFRNNQTGTGVLTNLWHSLRKNSDFMALFADRVYRSCFNNGQLTDAVSRARWQTLNNYIKNAIIGESARWGDAVGDGITRTKNDYWQPEVDRVDGLMNGNVQRFITALRAQGYYPSIDAPDFSREGGTRTSNLQLTITNPNASGIIYYTTNGSDPRLPGGGLSASAITYTGAIDIQNDTTIKARIKDGNTWSAMHEGTYFTPQLKINEFMASNASTLRDEFGVFDDWIEIYNNGSQPVDIGGMYVTDILTNPTQWKIPTTNPDLTTIPPQGFILLWADKETAQGPLHVDIKLSGSGEQIGLAMLDGATPVYIDSLTFGAQVNDISFGRFPDGSSVFRTFSAATPGSKNIVVQQPKNLYINEFLAGNTSGNTDEFGEHNAWIEIYNKNTQPVDIGGLYLTNNLANATLYQIPSGQPNATTIPANGFILLWADNQTIQGPLHLGFTLGPTSGEIGLVEKVGTDINYIDSTHYNSQTKDVSSGRYPDASVNFKSFSAPTPGSSNLLPLVSGVFINEFLASNGTDLKDENGENDDWFEIYNSNSTAVDLGGLFVTDNLANPGKWQIPASRPDLTTIPAGGFKLLWADEQPTQGALHTNIKLSGSGEQLGLVQINGSNTVFIDSLSFGAQATDISMGRYPNGSPNIVTFDHTTPGASNIDPTSLSFTLVNSTTDQDIQSLDNGAVLDLASLLPANRFNIRANAPANVASVKFSLSGKQTKTRTESSRPFALFGDINGNYNDWAPALGSYTLKVTPYSATGGGGTAGTPLTINFSIINNTNKIPTANAGSDKTITLPTNSTVLNGSGTDTDGTISTYTWSQVSAGPNTATFSPSKTAKSPTVSGLIEGSYIFKLVVTDNLGASSKPDSVTVTVKPASTAPKVTSFTLVNSATDNDIQTLSNGNILNLATLPGRKLNIRANTSGTVGSVVFNLSGKQTKKRTEASAPFSLFGDVNGDYKDWTPLTGSYTLKATPYSTTNGTGTAGTALTVNFTVTDQAAAIIAKSIGTFEEQAIQPEINQFKTYPNPNNKGRFTISLPHTFTGELSYTLMSLSGERLAGGKLIYKKPTSIINFDFSASMVNSGVYHLILDGKELKLQARLVKVK